MQEIFEKIIEKLEELKNHYNECCLVDYNEGAAVGLTEAMNIVRQAAAEDNNGWIPCGKRLPDELVPVNITWINRNPESYYAEIKDVPFTATGVYFDGKWYWDSCTCIDMLKEYGRSDFDIVDVNIYISAWQPLPEPCKPKED